MKQKAIRKKGRFQVIAAAAAMFVMLMGSGGYAYASPYYYVSLDVNPSVLMEVNMFERVIGVEAVNEDAAAVLEGLDLKNKDIKEAISVAVARIAEAGYFDEEGGNILIASAAKNDDKAERLAGKLQGAVEEEIVENGLKAEVSAGAAGYEMVQAAKGWGMTPGKYNIITNLLGETIDSQEEADDYINTPVKELMADFTAAKGAEGRERAEEAAANGQTDREKSEPAENAGLKEQNAASKAEQAGSQEGNAAVDTPASDKKAPNADAMQNNVTKERPATPDIPATPEVPADGTI